MNKDSDNVHLWQVHGVTVHGGGSLLPDEKNEPMAYYHRRGPAGQFMTDFVPRHPKAKASVIGLGAGSLIAYTGTEWDWTFYELDPLVQKIAEDGRWFTFLKNAAAPYRVVLGDARLSMSRADSSEMYDLIVLDAFGSDAIPVHLLTREALRLYLSRLKKGGVIAAHITSRTVRLYGVLARLADDAGLAALEQDDASGNADLAAGKFSSEWVVMARSVDDLGALISDKRWFPVRADKNASVWTDDFSNVLEVVDWE